MVGLTKRHREHGLKLSTASGGIISLCNAQGQELYYFCHGVRQEEIDEEADRYLNCVEGMASMEVEKWDRYMARRLAII